MNSMLENYNYHNDPRVTEPAEKPVLHTDEGEIELPTKWAVCPICQGEGTHTNPSIDCGGLTQDDFDQDPHFREEYMSGVYNVQCNYCEGRRVVAVVDPDQMELEVFEEYCQQLEEEQQFEAECRAERAMGC